MPKSPSESKTDGPRQTIWLKIVDIVGDILAQLGVLFFTLVALAGVGLWLDNYMRWTWRWDAVLLGSALIAGFGALLRRGATRQSN